MEKSLASCRTACDFSFCSISICSSILALKCQSASTTQLYANLLSLLTISLLFNFEVDYLKAELFLPLPLIGYRKKRAIYISLS